MTAPAPAARDVPASRLLVTLGGAGAVAGFLIVFVFRATQPAIQAHKAEVLRQAIEEVLHAPARYDTLYVAGNVLVTDPPPGSDVRALERIYAGYRADGSRVGFAIVASQPGFQDVIRLIVGYDPATDRILGMKVLDSKETPGLGDKIEKDSAFVAQFDGPTPPLVGVRPRDARGDPHEVDMITGATISSRTVIRAINQALERLAPALASAAEAATP